MDRHVTLQNASGTQTGSRLYVAERTHDDAFGNFSFRINVCERVDGWQTYSLSGALSLKSMVILAASSPSTVAVASIFPTAPFTQRILISWIN